jgi:plasmid maintenance system killer protein
MHMGDVLSQNLGQGFVNDQFESLSIWGHHSKFQSQLLRKMKQKLQTTQSSKRTASISMIYPGQGRCAQ